MLWPRPQYKELTGRRMITGNQTCPFVQKIGAHRGQRSERRFRFNLGGSFDCRGNEMIWANRAAPRVFLLLLSPAFALVVIRPRTSIQCNALQSSGFQLLYGGAGRNRTADKGFADLVNHLDTRMNTGAVRYIVPNLYPLHGTLDTGSRRRESCRKARSGSTVGGGS